MSRKRVRKQVTNAKLTIPEKQAVLKIIEIEEGKKAAGEKGITQEKIALAASNEIGRPVSRPTINNIKRDRETIRKQVSQPKRKPGFRLQSESVISWENQFDMYVGQVIFKFYASVLIEHFRSLVGQI